MNPVVRRQRNGGGKRTAEVITQVIERVYPVKIAAVPARVITALVADLLRHLARKALAPVVFHAQRVGVRQEMLRILPASVTGERIRSSRSCSAVSRYILKPSISSITRRPAGVGARIRKKNSACMDQREYNEADPYQRSAIQKQGDDRSGD